MSLELDYMQNDSGLVNLRIIQCRSFEDIAIIATSIET
jgi:hypothetical protein